MTGRATTTLLAAAAVCALAVGLLARTGPGDRPPSAGRAAPPAGMPPATAKPPAAGRLQAGPASPEPAPIDLDRLRNPFRYGAAPQAQAAPGPNAPVESAVLATAPAVPAGPRLVGVVRKSGRLLAALAQDGDVLLAAPGESAAGVAVLSVAEDGVRVRLEDGREVLLTTPE